MRGNVRQKGVLALAWISYALAVVGGAFLTATFLGSMIAGFVGWFPAWVATVAFAAAVVTMLVDLFVDGEPNRLALYSAMVIPSLAMAVPGRLGTAVRDLSGEIQAAVTGGMTDWLGTSSVLAIAFASVVVAMLIARRVVTKGR